MATAYEEWLKRKNTAAQNAAPSAAPALGNARAAGQQPTALNTGAQAAGQTRTGSLMQTAGMGQYSPDMTAEEKQAWNEQKIQALKRQQKYTEEEPAEESGPEPGSAASRYQAYLNRNQNTAGSEYSDMNKELLEELRNTGPYENQYADQIKSLYDRITGAEPYQSEYADQIRALYGQAVEREPYESPYAEQIKSLYDSLLNRPKFSYNPENDPLYQQYREQYIRGGQQAMRDTMGASAALTGGYGNSWGNTAGYQAYQQYLQGLNSVLPELSQAAFDRYQQEGDQIRSDLSTALAMDEEGYGRWQDENDRARTLLSTAMAMDEQDYGRYQDALETMRQNYNAAVNAEESDWQRYMQMIQALQQRMEFNAGMRAADQSYAQTAAASLGTGGGSGGGGVSSPASLGGVGSNFNEKEYAASLNGIRSGQLGYNESPLTTFKGSTQGVNSWYQDEYNRMKKEGNISSSGSEQSHMSGSGGGSKTGSGAGTVPLGNLWDMAVDAAKQVAANYNVDQDLLEKAKNARGGN
ncbi:MAG: hypothetical protein IJS41_11920 [Clostridia bacterium]|nr:hypothetical protein [Clostridia bacterium]